MIDSTKSKILDKEKIEYKLLSERDNYYVEGKYNYSIGKTIYPIRSRLENLFINITAKGGTIENSLHKYFNNLVSMENQNYNDFYFSDIIYALNVLEDEIDYPLEKTSLTHLEFGFNIELDICPTKFLKHHLLMYDCKSPCYNPKNNPHKIIQKYIYTEYEMKIYNKTLDQSRYKEHKRNLAGTKILRIEVKYKSKRVLNKLGVYALSDLRSPIVYRSLIKDFLTKYKNLLIIDSYDGNSFMSKRERQFIKDCTHPNYWVSLKETHHRNTISNHKDKLEKLIRKYGLNNWKTNLRRDIINKFNQLMDNDTITPIIDAKL